MAENATRITAMTGPDHLAEWVRAGLLTPEQADAIRTYEQARRPAAGTPRQSLVVEALGYLGGVIMLTGAGILAGLYWSDVAVAGRLLLTGVAAAGLIGAGAAVPDRLGPAAGRLRSVLWALGVAATGALMAVVSTDLLDRHDEQALLVIFPPTAAVALVLWWVRRTWLQQLALLVPLAMSGTAVAVQVTSSDSAPGLVTWCVAVGWTVVAWTGRIPPRGPGLVLGGAATVLASMTVPGQQGVVLGLATAAGLLALALAERSLPLLAVSGLGLLESTHRAVVEWFPGRLSASLTLIAVGGVLVGAAVWVARSRRGA